MDFRNISDTDIQISRFALGTWAFGSDYWKDQKHTDSIKTTRRALALGINFFDTAPAYGKGKAEQVLGQNLKNAPENIVIASKSMLVNETAFIRSIENSLKRLGKTYIDIFFIHWPKTGFDYLKTLELLDNYRNKGIIKAIGLSNFLYNDLKKASENFHIDAVQYAYNLLWRKIETEIVPFCQKKNISLLAYSPLAQGLLTKSRLDIQDLKEDDRRKNLVFFNEVFLPEINTVLSKFKQIADKHSISISDLAIAWIKSKPFIDSIIIGARTRQQLEKNYQSFMKNIDKNIISEIDRISEGLMVHYPESDNIFNHNF